MTQIQIKQYLKFVTTDGEEFDNRDDAENHQRALNIVEFVKTQNQLTYEPDYIDYADFIVKFWDELVTIVADQNP